MWHNATCILHAGADIKIVSQADLTDIYSFLPKLFFFQACSMLVEEELEAAISHCSMLEILNIHSCPKVPLLAIYESGDRFYDMSNSIR